MTVDRRKEQHCHKTMILLVLLRASLVSITLILDISRNPLHHADEIYKLTPAGRKFFKNGDIAKSKAHQVVKARRKALQDDVSRTFRSFFYKDFFRKFQENTIFYLIKFFYYPFFLALA